MNIRLIVLALVFASPALSLAQQDPSSWAGQAIVLKEPGIRIGHTDPKDGETQRYVATLKLLTYRVEADSDEFIKVRENGLSGWFPKEKAVLARDAVDYFTQTIQRSPENALLYQRRACAWHLQGQFDLAIKDLDEAIRLSPKDHNLYHCRGIAYQAQKDYDRAIQDFTEVLRIEPKDPIAYVNRGVAHVARKDYDRAIQDFTASIRLDPKYAQAYYNRGTVHKLQQNYDEAIEDLSKVIRLDPNHLSALLNRGWVCSQVKEYHRVIEDYTEVITLAPQDARGYNALAWFRATCPEQRFRDGAKAVELAKKACELTDWKKAEYLDTLAAAYAEQGEFQEAITVLKRALQDEEYSNTNGRLAMKRIRLHEIKEPYHENDVR